MQTFKMNQKQAIATPVSQQLLMSLEEHFLGMFYRCQNNSRRTMEYVNCGSVALTGYTAQELIFDKTIAFGLLIVADDYDRICDEISAAIKQNEHYKIVYRIRSKQGEIKWVCEQGFQAFGSESDSPVLEGIIVDITEQKRPEVALEDSKRRFHNLVDGSIEGICIHYKWQPLFANQTLADMLGYDTPAEILELNSIEEFIAPVERSRLLAYKSAREDGNAVPKRYKFEALRRDGTTVVLENVVTNIKWDERVAVLATFIDVTERNRALRELELQRKQLADVDRMSTLSEVTAGIAHEINQPLTAISNRCGAAKRRIDGGSPDLKQLRNSIAIIEQQAQRSGEIIQRMRNLANQQVDKQTVFNINPLVQQCLEFAEMDGRIQNINIRIALDAHLKPLLGDPIEIQQVILNLIRNSSDAMEQMAIADRRLSVSTKHHPVNMVQVAVSDSGGGISENIEAKLFQSFFTTKENGMGMGLSICRSIITAHGGHFWFTRNPNQGVTFRFTLPIALKK